MEHNKITVFYYRMMYATAKYYSNEWITNFLVGNKILTWKDIQRRMAMPIAFSITFTISMPFVFLFASKYPNQDIFSLLWLKLYIALIGLDLILTYIVEKKMLSDKEREKMNEIGRVEKKDIIKYYSVFVFLVVFIGLLTVSICLYIF